MAADDEEMVPVRAYIKESVHEIAKEKLEHGGISREIRETMNEVAFGEELTQRNRLERQREDVKGSLQNKRAERREIDAEIETLEENVQSIDEKLASITEEEDKYEAKLEEIESQLRCDGIRVWDDMPMVTRAAATGGVEPNGVIQTLKERNPDVPSYAFKDGFGDEHDWNGVAEQERNLPPQERERKFR